MKSWLPVIGAVVVLLVSSLVIFKFKNKPIGNVLPTPSPEAAQQLKTSDQPQVKLEFTADGHFVVVTISNLHADQLEYNLIYDATVKTNRINTGVNSTAKISGQTTFSQKQLLGSESSGKFTYHEKISNATMELILRNSAGQSIFSASYPFTVTPGSSVTPTPAE